ncbi:hypothetical protein TPHA_0D04140 [Tetrapisispora phaffii CBS 4417]|uniref:Nucleoporin Nup54 alpha-helical domain-containing protein n=1 Tax=Tetrapisispora phaffii (strain ATCC 24235 / CBS 4417 / NBRC 1672 / NRRL Y-8282 / UCD 70-5) TaxID=1071381 RepID=G8BT76_TETPH|nr:hypothetical protein TPHA_0D04140 [Tetrapisispora phaffii CBS 4417]CCE63047.1 hypothetical protein TPHA_0D04140 [Tetrapisispora phaffii CBS 4417]
MFSFGKTANNTATTGNTGTTAGFSFGQNSNTANTSAAAPGGLFSKPAAPQQTGSLFGGTPSQQAQPATSGLFGNTNPTTTTGGLFGNATTAPASGGLFGKSTGTQSAGNGLFGNTIAQPAQQQQQQPSLFGSNTLKSTQPSFAWTEQSQNNQQLSQPQQTQQQIQQQQILQQQQQMFQNSNYPHQIQEQLIKCKELWDPSNNKSKLKSFVYNKVDETEAILYSKPNTIPQEEWDAAIEKKPSKDMIPIEILGYDGLNQRNQLQRENVAQARVIFNQLLEKSTQLQQKHELSTSSRILKAQARNSEIEKRILKLGSQLAILKSRGLPLNAHEEKMWDQFETLLKRSENPAGLGKTNELWARLAVLKEKAKTISEQLDNTLVVIDENGAKQNNRDHVSEEHVENKIDKIAEILSNQQRGITYLNNVLVKDHATLDKLISK